MSGENRSEQATPRRRQKAREQGKIARSRDFAPALAVGAVVMIASWQMGNGLNAWKTIFRDLLLHSATEAVLPATWFAVLNHVAMYWLFPGMAVAFLISVFAGASQVGLIFAPALLKPQLERLSPGSHIKQLFSSTSALGLLKSLLPTAIIAYLVGHALIRDWDRLCVGVQLHIRSLAALVSARVFETAWKCGLVLIGWAAVDLIAQKRKFERDLRMTHQELREEAKESEGNPQVRARIRKLQRQVRRKRMLEDVARATVVITNPTEYAIALEYNNRVAAPVVVAKGRNLLAQQIKQAARWHGVPTIENVPLAHSLYRTVEVGQAIPAKLYAAVAEVLAFIMRAQARVAEAQ